MQLVFYISQLHGPRLGYMVINNTSPPLPAAADAPEIPQNTNPNDHTHTQGSYQCQINTNPMRSISGYLDVVGEFFIDSSRLPLQGSLRLVMVFYWQNLVLPASNSN